MKTIISISICVLLAFSMQAQTSAAVALNPYAIVVHGGAGGMKQGSISAEKEAMYKAALKRASDAGEKILRDGGNAIDAVQAAILILENDSLFNAGKGAVLNSEGYAEMDASIMNGSDLNSGAVAGITTVKNPILAARFVMDKSKHVMFSNKGAEQFAEEQGCEMVDRTYFMTERAKKRYKQVQENKGKKSQIKQPENHDDKYGTVGAVALDKKGNLAAGTSTGGMTNKQLGRIGDSPIIGAGTYADNLSAAVSCTGWGEYFIRLAFAKSICDRIELQGIQLKEATKVMIHEKLDAMGAEGGVIAVDRYGGISMDFNTSSMMRAWATSAGERGVALY